MRKPIEIYAFAVCFVTILWFIISFTMVVNDAVDLAFPRLMMTDEYNPVDTVVSNTQTTKSNEGKMTTQEKATAQAKAATEMENKKHALQAVKERTTVRGLIHELISLIISGFIFVIHWKLARKERVAQS